MPLYLVQQQLNAGYIYINMSLICGGIFEMTIVEFTL